MMGCGVLGAAGVRKSAREETAGARSQRCGLSYGDYMRADGSGGGGEAIEARGERSLELRLLKFWRGTLLIVPGVGSPIGDGSKFWGARPLAAEASKRFCGAA